MRRLRYFLAGGAIIVVVLLAAQPFVRGLPLGSQLAQVLSVIVLDPPSQGSGGGSSNSSGGGGAAGGGGGGGAPLASNLPLPATASKGDLSGDGKVTLADFSILAYWYKRTLTQAAITLGVDLNKDGKVSLADFSILAYYWKR